MIARLDGILESVDDVKALVAGGGGLVYEVLIPAFTVPRLQNVVGREHTFHTLTFLESMSQGASFIPRLAGFQSLEDKEFYELLISVKGLGYRRGLKAMNMAPARIAAAISDRDLKMLQTMPTIGRRNAETLAMDLKDKVDRFLTSSASNQPPGPTSTAEVSPGGADRRPSSSPTSQAQTRSGESAGAGRGRDAIEALVSMGEPRAEAVQLIDRILTGDNPPQDANGVLQAVYRIKGQ